MPDNAQQKQRKKRARGTAQTSMRAKLYEAEVLLNITKTVAAFETLDEVLEALVTIATRELGAERGTILLNDTETSELYSRVAMGGLTREIRLLNTSGIAGHVFTTGEGRIVDDTDFDPHFNRHIDERTGYTTRNMLCAPIKTVRGETIGVAEILNKQDGMFTEEDMELLNSMTAQAAVMLQSTQVVERLRKSHSQEMEFVDLVSDLMAEIDLGTLQQRVIGEVTRMLNCERSTIFLNDERTNELFILVAEGLSRAQIRMPNNEGVGGAVFTTGQSVNIPHAYADLRFNPSFDRETGFFTRSLLCVPIVNQGGKVIGVTQALNKRGGPFTADDEARLKAFTASVAISLENAKLFNEIQDMEKKKEGMLESMSNGVITVDEDGRIDSCNSAGLRVMQVEPEDIIGMPYEAFFTGPNQWVSEKVKRVAETRDSDTRMDADLVFGGEELSVNLTTLPLISVEQKEIGSMLIIEDITSEKRVKSTLSRHMEPAIADQLLESGEDILGGKSADVTILFSDIAGFTSHTEELGPHGTVSLLNEYFTLMVECIQNEGGMLDKFQGDAIMAAFGIPLAHDDDKDRAVRAAVNMIETLREWNSKRSDEGKKLVHNRIGISSAEVVTGNIGSPKRMDYTLIGDGVNLAARLESACKQYSTQILVSDYTYRELKGTYRSREIDSVLVQGKTEPVVIHEILDFHTQDSFANMMDVLNSFRFGIEQYRDRQWDRAIEAFQGALDLNPADQPSRIYIERCHIMKESPPPDDWDGVWVMTSK